MITAHTTAENDVAPVGGEKSIVVGVPPAPIEIAWHVQFPAPELSMHVSPLSHGGVGRSPGAHTVAPLIHVHGAFGAANTALGRNIIANATTATKHTA
ncbi:hypothetical protein HY839_04250 [Candidatus Azambacteria bacterium]|nr:hypothetical protein [Candidatus Azambacteria bacterium]